MFHVRTGNHLGLENLWVADARRILGLAMGHSGIFPAYVRRMDFPGADMVQCPCGKQLADPKHYLTKCPMFAVLIRKTYQPSQPPSSFPEFFHKIDKNTLILFKLLYRTIGAQQHLRPNIPSSFDTPPPSGDPQLPIDFSDHG